MSAAEAADRPTTGPGSVTYLNPHSQRRAVQPPDSGPQSELAHTIEALFLARQRTLTDPLTAEAYLITLEAVTMMVDGARTQGVVGEREHQILRDHLDGMVAATGT